MRKNFLKKASAYVLTALMLVSLIPTTAFAAEQDDTAKTVVVAESNAAEVAPEGATEVATDVETTVTETTEAATNAVETTADETTVAETTTSEETTTAKETTTVEETTAEKEKATEAATKETTVAETTKEETKTEETTEAETTKAEETTTREASKDSSLKASLKGKGIGTQAVNSTPSDFSGGSLIRGSNITLYTNATEIKEYGGDWLAFTDWEKHRNNIRVTFEGNGWKNGYVLGEPVKYLEFSRANGYDYYSNTGFTVHDDISGIYIKYDIKSIWSYHMNLARYADYDTSLNPAFVVYPHGPDQSYWPSSFGTYGWITSDKAGNNGAAFGISSTELYDNLKNGTAVPEMWVNMDIRAYFIKDNKPVDFPSIYFGYDDIDLGQGMRINGTNKLNSSSDLYRTADASWNGAPDVSGEEPLPNANESTRVNYSTGMVYGYNNINMNNGRLWQELKENTFTNGTINVDYIFTRGAFAAPSLYSFAFDVRYSAEEGGRITGKTQEDVPNYAFNTGSTQQANTGYVFKGWKVYSRWKDASGNWVVPTAGHDAENIMISGQLVPRGTLLYSKDGSPTVYYKDPDTGREINVDISETKVINQFVSYVAIYEPEGKVSITKSLPDITANIELVKTSADEAISGAAWAKNNYSLQGAEYTIYSDSACTKKVGAMTTDAYGKATYKGLKKGKYYVKETKASKGYELDTTVYEYDLSNIDGGYDKAAEYTVYSDIACTKSVGKLTCNATTGVSNELSLSGGDYWVKETKASKGCELNTGVKKITISAGSDVKITDGIAINTIKPTTTSKTVKEQPKKGKMKLTKATANALSDENNNYTLQGAVYEVYSSEADAEAGKNVRFTATTDANGSFTVSNIPIANYWVKEKKASKGFGLAVCSTEHKDHTKTDLHKFSVTETNWETVQNLDCKEPPLVNALEVFLQKIDKETGEPYPQGSASLKDAEYEIKFFANKDKNTTGTPTRTWKFKTAEDGKLYTTDETFFVEGDELYKDAKGNVVYPLGSYVIKETKPSEGYIIDTKAYTVHILEDGKETHISKAGYGNDVSLIETSVNGEPVISDEPVARGEFRFTKTMLGVERLANCLFEVTNTVTGEKHYLVTDYNGVFNSSNYTSNNGNDEAVTINEDGSYTVDEEKLSYKNNVYFSMNTNGTVADINEENASFPYGTYRFKEIKTSVNEDFSMIEFTGSIVDETNYLRGKSIEDLGTKDDQWGPEKNYSSPKMTEDTVVKVGDEIGYDLFWINPEVKKQDITLYDTLSVGLEYVEGSANVEPADVIANEDGTTTVVWIFKNARGLQEGDVIYKARVTDEAKSLGEVHNDYDIQYGNGPKQDVNDLHNPLPPYNKTYTDPQMTQDSVVEVGDKIGYTLTWANTESKEADIILYDTLSKGLEYVKGSASVEPTSVKANTDGTTEIIWNLGKKAADEKGEVTYEAEVTKDAVAIQLVDNKYEIQIGKNNPKTFVETLENPLKPYKEYTDPKMTEETFVKVGDEIGYTLNYVNKYNSKADLVLYDTLSKGLEYVEGSASIAPTLVKKNTDGTTEITWKLGKKESHATGTITYKASVTEFAKIKLLVNNDYDLETVPVGREPKAEDRVDINELENPLKPEKTYTDPKMTEETVLKVGDEVGYSLSWNNKYKEAKEITLYDTLSKGLEYVEGSASIAPASVKANSDGTTEITWKLGKQDGHAIGAITYKAKVNGNALATLRVNNDYDIQVGDDPREDINELENPLEPKDPKGPKKAYTDAKMTESTVVKVGDNIGYTLTWANSKTEETEIILYDTLSKGLEYVEGSASVKPSSVKKNTNGTTEITWNLGKKAAKADGTVTYKVKVTKDAETKMVVNNDYDIQIGSDPRTDVNSLENPLKPSKAYTDAKMTESTVVKEGDNIGYTLNWINTDNKKSEVILYDTLSKGLEYVKGSAYVEPTSVNTKSDGTTEITWKLGVQDAHKAGKITYKARVTKAAATLKQVNNDYDIEIGNHGRQDVNSLKNPTPSATPGKNVSPKTGDTTNWIMWAVIAAAALGAAGMVIVVRRKKNNI